MPIRDYAHGWISAVFMRAAADAGIVERAALRTLEKVAHAALDETLDRLEKSGSPLEPVRNLP